MNLLRFSFFSRCPFGLAGRCTLALDYQMNCQDPSDQNFAGVVRSQFLRPAFRKTRLLSHLGKNFIIFQLITLHFIFPVIACHYIHITSLHLFFRLCFAELRIFCALDFYALLCHVFDIYSPPLTRSRMGVLLTSRGLAGTKQRPVTSRASSVNKNYAWLSSRWWRFIASCRTEVYLLYVFIRCWRTGDQS